MATVTNTIKLPDGSTPDRVDVLIELVASSTGKAPAWISSSDVTLVAAVRPTVTAGAWSVSLTPNDDIDPSGTVYKVTEYVDKTKYVHYIEVGSGGGTVHDLLTAGPDGPMFDSLAEHSALTTAHSNPFTICQLSTNASDNAATLTAAAAAGGLVLLPAGTYAFTSSPSIPSNCTVQGMGTSTRLTFSGSGTFISLSSKSQVELRNMRISSSNNSTANTLVKLDGCFRCSLNSVVLDGSYTTSSDNTNQTGVELRNNSGDNRFIDCDFNNFAKGVATSASQNYFVGCVFGSNRISVHGDSGSFTAGISAAACTFVSASSSVTNTHVLVDTDAGAWWFDGVWFEGCANAIVAGDDTKTHGPFSFGMVNCKVAATTTCITLNSARQAYLANIIFAGDSANTLTPTPLSIDSTGAAEGTAMNFVVTIPNASYYFDTSVFPSGWTFTGRKMLKPPVFSTANRPVAADVRVGAMGYDSTLGKPIWSNGTVWKDAAGTTV